MSHLNELLSALVDGELNGTELDRVNAHLAACEQCRSEAAALRMLKRELRNLATMRHSDDLTRRLLAMAGPGGPVPPRRQLAGVPRPRPAFRAYPDRPVTPRAAFAARAYQSRPGPHSPADAWARRVRRRGVTVGVLSLGVTVGIVAFVLSLVGLDLPSGARITPQMEFSSIEHAFVSGDIPMLFDPGQVPRKAPPTWVPTRTRSTSFP
jgi:anti-sigma factor RsiW